MELIIGIIAIALQIVMFLIIFSLPSRFREQREYIEAQCQKIEKKMDIILELQKK